MKILVSNVGSTSLKFKLYEMPAETVLCTGRVERIGSEDAIFFYERTGDGTVVSDPCCSMPSYTEGIGRFIDCLLSEQSGVLSVLDEVDAVGFKTVAAKGYYGVHELTDDVLQAMKDYLPVAPAHNTAYLEAIGCFRALLPGVPFIGVFETAFHQTIPEQRYLYSLPYDWYEQYGVRKLGYHGASHAYAASVLTERYGNTGKAVTCHLGGSGSLCAVEDGKSVDTSFGMSLQLGLPQNNRVGDFDPYIIRYLEAQGLSEDAIFEALTSQSGLLGVSGVGRDLRDIERAANEGNHRAQLAIDQYVESIVRYIGAYAAELGGLDNLVFTGGIGEHSALVRAAVCETLRFLGVQLDEEQNRLADGTHIAELSQPESAVRVLLVPANEEVIVCRKTLEYLNEKS